MGGNLKYKYISRTTAMDFICRQSHKLNFLLDRELFKRGQEAKWMRLGKGPRARIRSRAAQVALAPYVVAEPLDHWLGPNSHCYCCLCHLKTVLYKIGLCNIASVSIISDYQKSYAGTFVLVTWSQICRFTKLELCNMPKQETCDTAIIMNKHKKCLRLK